MALYYLNKSADVYAESGGVVPVVAQIPAGASVSNLTQTISNPPTQAEVQAIQTTLNALLNSLRVAEIIDS